MLKRRNAIYTLHDFAPEMFYHYYYYYFFFLPLSRGLLSDIQNKLQYHDDLDALISVANPRRDMKTGQHWSKSLSSGDTQHSMCVGKNHQISKKN